MGEHGGNINQRPLKIAQRCLCGRNFTRAELLERNCGAAGVQSISLRCLFTCAPTMQSRGEIYTGGADPDRPEHFHLNIKKGGARKKGSEKWWRGRVLFFHTPEKVISSKWISSHLCPGRKNTLQSVGERDEWEVFCLFDAAARALSHHTCEKPRSCVWFMNFRSFL